MLVWRAVGSFRGTEQELEQKIQIYARCKENWGTWINVCFIGQQVWWVWLVSFFGVTSNTILCQMGSVQDHSWLFCFWVFCPSFVAFRRQRHSGSVERKKVNVMNQVVPKGNYRKSQNMIAQLQLLKSWRNNSLIVTLKEKHQLCDIRWWRRLWNSTWDYELHLNTSRQHLVSSAV